MTDVPTMHPPCANHSPRRRWGRRALIALVLVLGLGGVAVAAAPPHRHPKPPASAEEARAHLGHVTGRVLEKVEATAEQRARVDRVLDVAAPALWNFGGEARDLHREIHDLLTAETIDRAALEEARKDGLELADRGSKVLVSSLADLAEALTPAQRRRIAETMARFHH